MKTVSVKLDSIEKIKEFADIISMFECRFTLSSGKYVIDAASVMSIFSLDLSKPVTLSIYSTGEELLRILALLEAYIIA